VKKSERPDSRDRSGPPPPANDATRGLDEVERALSVLDGRHPEHQRAARETKAALEQKRAQAEQQVVVDRARARRRALIFGSGVVATIAIVLVIGGLVRRSNRTTELLALASAPWEARGFSVIASSGLWTGAHLETAVDAGCVVVVSTVDGPLAVERNGARFDGTKTIGWCACDKEQLVVTTSLPPGTAGGARVLRIDGGAVGGATLFARGDERPATFAKGGDECAEANLDEWIVRGRHPAAPVDDRSLDGDGPRAAFRRAGFHVVAAAPAAAPFVIASLPQASCGLVESTEPGELLSLRAAGGARVASANGALAWCDAAGGAYTVWHDAAGDLRVLAAPSKRLGGMLGLRDAALAAGMKTLSTWTRPDDRGADAADALRSSFVADVVVSPDGNLAAGGSQEKRIVAISREADTELIVTSPQGAYYLCSPPLGPGVTHAICIESAPHSWRARGDAKVGIASAPMPFWMASFATIHEPDAFNGALALLGVARRLGAAGFSPTILGGATETAKGVDVLGRAGEDAVVAIGFQPKPPWVLPYTNGAAWDVSGEPVVVPLAPFAHAILTVDPPPSTPKESRRTVVFRRAVAKP
jgi:hypothetical protein